MLQTFLSENAQVRRVANAAVVATTEVDASVVDMATAPAFDSVLFVALLGTVTDGTPTLKAAGSSDDAVLDAYSDLLASGSAAGATSSNKLLVLDIKRPEKRYVKAILVRGGNTGCVVDGILAILYDSKKVPITQHSSVSGTPVRLVTPAEGTA